MSFSFAGHQLHSQPSHAPQCAGNHLAFDGLWGGVPTTIRFQMRNPEDLWEITIHICLALYYIGLYRACAEICSCRGTPNFAPMLSGTAGYYPVS